MILKRISVFILGMLMTATIRAQYGDITVGNDSGQPTVDTAHKAFKHYFIGGNFLAGFGDGGGAFGINPTIGYSINKYIDVGIGLNAVYNYQKYYNNEKLRTWNLGLAPYARIYPIDFLFFEASFEENLVSSRHINSDGTKDARNNYTVPSLIGAVGYATRVYGQTTFFFSVGMDFLNNINSPYRNQYYDENGTLRSQILPIIRTGFNINLW